MKYNWANVSTELRKIVLENVTLPGSANNHMRYIMSETDNFHPWDTDIDLCDALKRHPKGQCNYRSCVSYWEFKDAKDFVLDGIYVCLEEMGEKITEYYSDRYNFNNGVQLPDLDNMKFNWAKIADRSYTRIMKAARR